MNDIDPALALQAKRASYADGLRILADIIDGHPEVPLPYEGNDKAITMHFLSGPDPRAAMAAAVRVLPCKLDKNNPGEGAYDASYLDLEGMLAGLRVKLVAEREAVCERVVVGTEDREVEEVITPAVTRTVTQPVEVVEWRCHSILAPAEAAGVSA